MDASWFYYWLASSVLALASLQDAVGHPSPIPAGREHHDSELRAATIWKFWKIQCGWLQAGVHPRVGRAGLVMKTRQICDSLGLLDGCVHQKLRGEANSFASIE